MRRRGSGQAWWALRAHIGHAWIAHLGRVRLSGQEGAGGVYAHVGTTLAASVQALAQLPIGLVRPLLRLHTYHRWAGHCAARSARRGPRLLPRHVRASCAAHGAHALELARTCMLLQASTLRYKLASTQELALELDYAYCAAGSGALITVRTSTAGAIAHLLGVRLLRGVRLATPVRAYCHIVNRHTRCGAGGP